MATPERIEYPHVTTDPAVRDGQPCIAETGIRVTELFSAHENGNSPVELQEYFRRRAAAGDPPVRPLTLSEVFAGLAYYCDNVQALEAVRVEEERLTAVATKERQAAILKYYLGD
jgi:uncharacterized protein (DUF433 family)